jgi:hypothetical protein
MAGGCEVLFSDLEGDGGFDFLARIGTELVEIECKHVSRDIGRKVPQRHWFDLCNRFLNNERAKQAISQLAGGHIVTMQIADRLSGNLDEQTGLTNAFLDFLDSGAASATYQPCTISRLRFDIGCSPFLLPLQLSEDILSEFIRQETGVGNSNASAVFSKQSARVVIIRSEKPDTVLFSIMKNLIADAKRQLSGARPAALFVHLADLGNDQIVELSALEKRGEITGIRRAISAVINRRPYLVGVALTARPRAIEYQGPYGGASQRESNHAYYILNDPRPNFPADRFRRAMFAT